MSITNSPIKNMSIKELGVTPDMFKFESTIHGAGHTNRVIYNALSLAKLYGMSDKETRHFWACAFLHDLGRTTDGIDKNHGAHSADRYDEFSEIFKRAGVEGESSKVFVKAAVAMHSVPIEELIVSSHFMQVIQTDRIEVALKTGLGVAMSTILFMLKDADTLDRVRLGEPIVTQRYLADRTKYLSHKAARLWAATVEETSMETIWSEAVGIYCPHHGSALAILDNSSLSTDSDGIETMLRRLDAGGQCWPRYDSRLNSEPPDDLRVCTYMSEESYREFSQCRNWKNFWQTGPTWHKKYNDAPEDARAYNEIRLYGEKGNPLTHAVMLETCEQDRNLRRMYGKVRVQWNNSVVKCSTYTPEDSQENAKVTPFFAFEKITGDKAPRYYELQIHKSLTTDDIKEVCFEDSKCDGCPEKSSCVSSGKK